MLFKLCDGSQSRDLAAEQEPLSMSVLRFDSTATDPARLRGFELLRLAFFVAKRRGLERCFQNMQIEDSDEDGPESLEMAEYALGCRLLQHAIFQQVLALSELDARDQALRLIRAA